MFSFSYETGTDVFDGSTYEVGVHVPDQWFTATDMSEIRALARQVLDAAADVDALAVPPELCAKPDCPRYAETDGTSGLCPPHYDAEHPDAA